MHDGSITSVSLDQGAPRHLRTVQRGDLDLELAQVRAGIGIRARARAKVRARARVRVRHDLLHEGDRLLGPVIDGVPQPGLAWRVAVGAVDRPRASLTEVVHAVAERSALARDRAHHAVPVEGADAEPVEQQDGRRCGGRTGRSDLVGDALLAGCAAPPVALDA